jgi:cytochrome c553
MRLRSVVLVLVACIFTATLVSVVACAPAAPPPPDPAMTPKIHGTLIQVMRAILFINSNVIFTAQATDPLTMPEDEFPATSPHPMTGLYGKWESVENAGVALSEAANLLIIPGRMCANGVAAPIDHPKWKAAVQGLRDAGEATLKAAKTKNQDAIVEVSETLANACAACHEIWRDVEPIENRCRTDLPGAGNANAPATP